MEQDRILPIGTQDFEKLRTDGCVYVDKTALVHRLAQESHPYFLARPRRFGKSLLISTMDAYFSGRKDLFRGLAIETLEKDWTEYPVLKIDFTPNSYPTNDILAERLKAILSGYEEKYDVEKTSGDFGERLNHLITSIYGRTGRQVVILIDEYDKPVLDALFTEQEEANRAMLRGFYSPLKGCDHYIRFLFITGITKVSHVNIFSGLNQLDDISMNYRYNALCGISESELKTYFKQEIESLGKAFGKTFGETVEKLALWYDGYHFSADIDGTQEGMYNPFSLLKALNERNFSTYWFETGTPSFLVKTLLHEPLQLAGILNGRKAGDMAFKNYEPESGNLLPVIYQSGYLTIKAYDKETNVYTLGFPNKEVEDGFTNAVLPKFISVPDNDLGLSVEGIRDSLREQDLDGLMEIIRASFSDIPVILRKNQCENYYQTIFHVLIRMTGFPVFSELQSIRGRSDVVVTAKDAVFIFELKMDRGRPWQEAADAALAQIEQKGYAARYAVSGKTAHKVGVVFSSEAQGLVGWKAE